MSEETESNVEDVKGQLAEIEKRRAERRAATANSRKKQYLQDMIALDELEEEHGEEEIGRLDTERFVPGLPTFIIIKAPGEVAFKRYQQQVRSSGGKPGKLGEAQDALAEVSWIYPDDTELKAKMRKHFPAILPSIVVEATRLAELRSHSEGKG